MLRNALKEAVPSQLMQMEAETRKDSVGELMLTRGDFFRVLSSMKQSAHSHSQGSQGASQSAKKLW